MFHVEAPLVNNRQHSSRNNAPLKDTFRPGNFHLFFAVAGGLVATVAPVVSCALGHMSDKFQKPWSQCWDQDNVSISLMVTSPVGSAYFAAGVVAFYISYLWLFFGILEVVVTTHRWQQWSKVGICFETLGAAVCVLHPMIYPLVWVHKIASRTWVSFATLMAFFICVVTDPLRRKQGLYAMLVARVTLFTPLAIALLALVVTDEYDQVFMVLEYCFLAIQYGSVLFLFFTTNLRLSDN